MKLGWPQFPSYCHTLLCQSTGPVFFTVCLSTTVLAPPVHKHRYNSQSHLNTILFFIHFAPHSYCHKKVTAGARHQTEKVNLEVGSPCGQLPAPVHLYSRFYLALAHLEDMVSLFLIFVFFFFHQCGFHHAHQGLQPFSYLHQAGYIDPCLTLGTPLLYGPLFL